MKHSRKLMIVAIAVLALLTLTAVTVYAQQGGNGRGGSGDNGTGTNLYANSQAGTAVQNSAGQSGMMNGGSQWTDNDFRGTFGYALPPATAERI